MRPHQRANHAKTMPTALLMSITQQAVRMDVVSFMRFLASVPYHGAPIGEDRGERMGTLHQPRSVHVAKNICWVLGGLISLYN